MAMTLKIELRQQCYAAGKKSSHTVRHIEYAIGKRSLAGGSVHTHTQQ